MSSLLTSQKIQIVKSQCSIFLICVTFNNLFPTSCLNSLLLFQNMSSFCNHFLHIATGLYFCLTIFCYQTKNVYSFLRNASPLSFLPRSKFRTTTLIQFSLETPMPYSQCLPSTCTHTALITLDIKVSI